MKRRRCPSPSCSSATGWRCAPGGTSDALQALFNLVPPKARVVRSGQVVEVATSELQRGDLIELRSGDKVPVDGVVREGETAIDEALVTGESIPVTEQPDDQVIGGTINQAGVDPLHGDESRRRHGTGADRDRSAFLSGAWKWWVIPPGLLITTAVLGFAFTGFALEELLNPCLRRAA